MTKTSETPVIVRSGQAQTCARRSVTASAILTMENVSVVAPRRPPAGSLPGAVAVKGDGVGITLGRMRFGTGA